MKEIEQEVKDLPSTRQEEEILAALLDHAKDDLRLAEFKAIELRYFHTADDCRNARIAIEKLIATRKG